jgi:SpoVK/Ycf46/Vps4 family AAA+-type ATPase
MSDVVDWQVGNDRYLATALAWLRLRLQRLAESMAGARPGADIGLLGLFGGRSPGSAGKRVVDAEMAQAAEAMAAAKEMGPVPALELLGRRFGLSRFEREVLLLCAAAELDTRIAGLCARAQDDPQRPYPTFALALALFDDPAWEVLSPERPLRYWRLIEINQPAAQPLTTSPLRADERIVNHIKGLNYVDDRLAPLLVPFGASGGEETELPPSQWAAVQSLVHYLAQGSGDGRPPVIQLVGPDALSKQLIAQHTAAQLDLQLVRLPAELLPVQAAELETLARLWQRESILLPVALYLDAYDIQDSAAEGGTEPVVPLHRFLARSAGLVFLDTREVQTGLGRSSFSLDVDKPVPAEQQAAWAEALGPEAGDSPARLAGQFNLNLTTIQQIARAARVQVPDEERSQRARVWEACLIRTRPRLDRLAQRLEPKAAWSDIVLPDELLALLHQIADQVDQRTRVYDDWGFRQRMNRGLGISALFGGESGTGKTMAAEVLANDLQLNLYRIDLSAVVSKYIGETEKNLRRLFDAAEDGGAILFFDEADALFGKRSEVKDSHDRYANIEINYLLQRMEAYRGLAILATNMKSALDQAFLRRLRFIANFPFPSAADRKRIWEKVFPPDTPTAGLDMDWLARMNLTGGSIHNIALNAAFLAARSDPPRVTMPLVLQAARTEFRKLEKPFSESELTWTPKGEGPKEEVST